MRFGKILQELREAAGLSQPALARLADTPVDSVRNWEQGKALPRLDAATRLAKALGVSLDQLGREHYEGKSADGSNGAQAKPGRRKKPAGATAAKKK